MFVSSLYLLRRHLFSGMAAPLTLSLFLLLAGWLQLRLVTPVYDGDIRPGDGVFSGVVSGLATPALSGARLVVDVVARHTPGGDLGAGGRMLLYARGMDPLALEPGRLIRFRARVSPIRRVKTPGVPDRASFWRRKGVFFQGSVPGPQLLVIGEKVAAAPLETLRWRIARIFFDNMPSREAGMALALLLGEKGWLMTGEQEAFRRLGLGHILAVSGLHMGMVALFVGFLVMHGLGLVPGLLLLVDRRKMAAAAALATGLVYAGLAGFSPSASRALVMIASFALALWVGTRTWGMNGLGMALWTLLLIRPWSVGSPGLQMSAAAVGALLLLAEKGGGRMPRAASLAAASLVAWGATAPLVAFHFHRLALAGPVANVLLVPPFSLLALPLALAAPALHPAVPAVSHLFFRLLEAVLGLLSWVMEWAASLPGLELRLAWQHGVALGLALWGVPLAVLGLGVRSWKGRAALASCLAAAAWFALYTPFQCAVHVLDVGPGLSQVVEADGAAIVVDAGPGRQGTLDAGERIVAPFLWSRGYIGVDSLIVSHPQADHAGGVAYLLENFRVRRLVLGRNFYGHPLFRYLEEKARQKGTTVVWVADRWEGRGGGAALEVLGPGECGCRGVNENGLVVLVELEGRRLLFPGDIGRCRERCMVQEGQVSTVDLLVVAHHGSRGSSSRPFLDAARPARAVVPQGPWSVGRDARNETCALLSRMGARVWSVAEAGTFSWRLDVSGRAVQPR